MTFLSILVVALALSTQPLSAYRHYQTLWVENGQGWGTWRNIQMCPSNTYAEGFSMRVHQGGPDHTAVNGIRLYCVHKGRVYGNVTSHSGYEGDWTAIKWCNSGKLKSFQLLVQPYQHGHDDTAVNNIQFTCSGGDVVRGFGVWARYSAWGPCSRACRGGGAICGIQTNVQGPPGKGDDTGLNNVRFLCC